MCCVVFDGWVGLWGDNGSAVLESGPSTHPGVIFTMATWLPMDRKQAQVAERGEEEEKGGKNKRVKRR